MISKKRFLALTLSTALAASLLTGCGTGNTAATQNTADQASSSAEAGNTTDYSGTTITGKVTAVNDKEITLSIGGRGGLHKDGKGRADFNKNFDSSDAPADLDNSTTPPELPAENTDDKTPPELPAENTDDKNSPEINSSDDKDTTDSASTVNDDTTSSNNKDTSGDADQSSGKKNIDKKRESKTVTITIEDESVLKDMSLSDITEGTRLTVTFDDNGSVSSVSQAGDDFGPDGKGMGPNGKDRTKTKSQSR